MAISHYNASAVVASAKPSRQPYFTYIQWAEHFIFFGIMAWALGANAVPDRMVLIRTGLIAIGLSLLATGLYRCGKVALIRFFSRSR